MACLLAIETSCDETAVAIVENGRRLLASQVASQAAIHARYGGVVPEVASRNHLPGVAPLVRKALQDARLGLAGIDVFAATAGPGLPSALLVGMAFAKSLAIGAGKPFVAVNHVEGHLVSPFAGEEVPAHTGLVVSGGHTILVDVTGFGSYHILGSTLDDAAGEAFDKVSKLLGLGYPGGVEIEKLARGANDTRFDFPRAMLHSGDYAFSFSGLKTAVRKCFEAHAGSPEVISDICASFQKAVIEVLVTKTIRAASAAKRATIALSGGVSSNLALRNAMGSACRERGISFRVAEPDLRTDNAAMIAFAGWHQWQAVGPDPIGTDIRPTAGANPFERFSKTAVSCDV